LLELVLLGCAMLELVRKTGFSFVMSEELHFIHALDIYALENGYS